MIVKMVKIYLGRSLVVLWAVWGQFIFGQFLDPAYISQDLQAPSYVVSTNYRVLIYCTCHFQGGSLCFSVFCLLVSSVSNFHPDTRGQWWTLFQAHLFSPAPVLLPEKSHGRRSLVGCSPWGGKESLPPHSTTEQVSLKKKKVSYTVPFVSGWKPDTEETSKQKKL